LKVKRTNKKERSKAYKILKTGKAAIKNKEAKILSKIKIKKQNETMCFVSFLGFFFVNFRFRTGSQIRPETTVCL
jgi:hypothetical protein